MSNKKITLKAEEREETGRKMRLSVENRIPAIIYGSGMEAKVLWVDSSDFMRAFHEAGKNTVIELQLAKDKIFNVLVHEYQVDPVSNDIIHVDFMQVRMDKVVEAEVPLSFVGESAAVKEQGGTLVKAFDVVDVKALPADLPHEIEVDLSKIATFEDHITIKDIKVSDKVELVMDVDTIIASVSAPRTSAEMDALNEEVDADVSKVEGAIEDKTEETKENK